MGDECIHGLPGRACAICFPETTATADTARPGRPRPSAGRTRPARPPRRAPARAEGRASRAAGDAPASRAGNVDTARLYHVTHAANLPAIVEAGALLPAASCVGRTAFDCSSAANRAARGAILIGGRPVSDHVPFYLSPNANLWQGILSGTDDPRLSEAARSSSGGDYVMLVVPLADAFQLAAEGAAEVVASDGDAAGPLARFAETAATTRILLARALAEEEPEVALRAEVLVPTPVPLQRVAVIGVPNTTARETVRRELAGTGVRVSVYPPWFQPRAL